MQIRIGLENRVEGRSIAWALDHPGCFAYGKDAAEALLNVPRAVLAHVNWLGLHTVENWLADLGDFDVRLVETFEVYTINERYESAAEGYEVNAWFRNDWKPLTRLEVNRALDMLAWSRSDLLELVKPLSVEVLDEKRPEERWSIRGILGHVATAEWWYLDRLGLTSLARADLPKDVFDRLALIRASLVEALPGLAGAEQVVGRNGEFWSPRKLVRRALWHERDHYFHILRLSMEPPLPS